MHKLTCQFGLHYASHRLIELEHSNIRFTPQQTACYAIVEHIIYVVS